MSRDLLAARDIQWYGWKRDLPDHRDLKYRDVLPQEVTPMTNLPPLVDLRPKLPPVYDQGQLGSCTANACAGAMQFLQPGVKPSRLFIYYNEREIEGTTEYDAGGELRDVIKAAAIYGACDESIWPYVISRFTVKPEALCYQQAESEMVTKYMRVNGLQEMKSCLAAGYPFIFGFTVYESFESLQVASTGILNMPGPNEESLGGHAVMCVGYDDASQRVIVRNSWGSDWGQRGYFTMPYEFITNPDFASDMWTIRQEGPAFNNDGVLVSS